MRILQSPGAGAKYVFTGRSVGVAEYSDLKRDLFSSVLIFIVICVCFLCDLGALSFTCVLSGKKICVLFSRGMRKSTSAPIRDNLNVT